MTRRHVPLRMPVLPSLTGRLASSLLALAAGGALGVAEAQVAPNALPVLQTAPVGAAVSAAGSQMTVNQSAQRVTIDWSSFNIGRDAAVQFVQPNAAAAALNRIWDINPSIIQGRLSANGQVWLLNQNGILFDRGSQVNVGSLVASSIALRDLNPGQNWFTNPELLQGQSRLVLDGGGGPATAVVLRGTVETPNGGQVMVFGRRVENEGMISAPGGQVILAAGERVWLSDQRTVSGSTLRGFQVEFRAGNAPVNLTTFLAGTTATATVSDTSGATVVNTGAVASDRGLVSIAGLAVNQQGRVSASSSAVLGGTVWLLARERAAEGGDSPARGGTVLFAAGSRTDNPLDTVDRSTTAQSAAYAADSGRITVEAQNIHVRGELRSPGGRITLDARDAGAGGTSRVLIDDGALVSAAGHWADLPAGRALLEVQLTSNELKDSPLLRGGPLQGQKVTIDIRRGSPLFDAQPFIDAIQRPVEEKAVAGGTVRIVSTSGDIVIRPGATVDVSGGGLRYAAGAIATTRVSSQGRLFDIADAPRDRIYDLSADTYVHDYGRWGMVTYDLRQNHRTLTPADLVGADAGLLELYAPAGIAVEGDLRGGIAIGSFQAQRETTNAGLPRAGRFVAGDPAGVVAGLTDTAGFAAGPLGLGSFDLASVLRPDLVNRFVAPVAALFGQPGTRSATSYGQSGFGSIEIAASGLISVPAGQSLELPAGGAVTLSGGAVTVGGTIRAPSGTIILQGVNRGGGVAPAVTVGSTARLDVSGEWVNQSPRLLTPDGLRPRRIDVGGDLTAAARDLLNGGLVSVDSETVTLAAGSTVLANAGALLTGRRTGTGTELETITEALTPGRAGTIRLQSLGPLAVGSALEAYGFQSGGTLELRSNEIRLGGSGTFAGLALDAGVFRSGGFTQFRLNSPGSITVAAGAQIVLQAQNLLVDRTAASMLPSGGSLRSIAAVTMLAEDQRGAASLTLNAPVSGGAVRVDSGASIVTDPRGGITMIGGDTLTVLGGLSAPGGSIVLSTNSANVDSAGLRIAAGAVLSTAGRFVAASLPVPNRVTGEVLAGGNISLASVRAPLEIEAGATLDVSGASARLDLPVGSALDARIESRRVDSDAGAVTVSATNRLRLNGTLIGRAATGAAGGALGIDYVRTGLPAEDPVARTLVLSAGAAGAAGLASGRVSLAGLTDSGFDRLRVRSEDVLEFAGALGVSLGRSLELNAPEFRLADGAAVTLAAPRTTLAVSLPDGRTPPAVPPVPQTGTGSLTVNGGGVLDLIGDITVHRAATVTLASGGDLRLYGNPVNTDAVAGADTLRGALRVAGDLVVQAAQTYPGTLSDFTLVSTAGRIDVLPGATTSMPALSAGGVLRLEAARVLQGGVLRAPLGRIELGTASSAEVELRAGSLTSVSAAGLLVPVGGTVDGGDRWQYRISQTETIALTTPPSKQVRLAGTNVLARPGSVIDTSGGGEFFGLEHVPGPGGSADFLAGFVRSGGSVNQEIEVYAVLPQLAGGFAPRDRHLALVRDWGFGRDALVHDAVRLTGVPGLADGVYPLLHGYYAFLPGAVLVRPQSGFADLLPGQTAALADGTPVYAAVRAVSGSAITQSRSGGFAVGAPGFRTRGTIAQAEYILATSSFLADQALVAERARPQLPGDAGMLTLAATGTLELAGMLRGAAAAGATGGQIEVTAGNIAVVGSLAQAAPSGFLRLTAASLSSGDTRITLGARRDGGNLVVVASNVLVENNAATALVAPEIMLAATSNITVSAGSVLRGEGAYSGMTQNLTTAGPGALLRVASGPHLTLARTGNLAGGGNLSIGVGALVRGERSLLADATASNLLGGAIEVGAGGTLEIGAPRISIGGGASGLVLSPVQVAALAAAENIALRSYSSIDLHGAVTLGGAATRSLRLSGSGIAGYDGTAAANTRLVADTVTLDNAGNAAAGSTGTAVAGTLAVSARRIVAGAAASAGAGNLALSGFSGGVLLHAAETMLTLGTGNLAAGAALEVRAARITAATGSNFGFSAGTITLAASGANLPAEMPAAGGRIGFSATGTLTQGGRIETPSGQVVLSAGGDLVLGAGSYTGAPSFARELFGIEVASSAGRVLLTSTGGSVRTLAGSTIDVSGTRGGDAGELVVGAAGAGQVFDAGGVLSGAATGGGRSGRFSLDTGAAGNIAALVTSLGNGFAESRTVRARSGNLSVAAGEVFAAREVRMTADAGAISVAGTVDASSTRGGGRIEFYASGNVSVASGGRLVAAGIGAGAGGDDPHSNGGLVRLETRNVSGGVLNFAAGATIDVSAGARGDAGRIEFITSAASLAAGNIAQSAFAGTVAAGAGAGGRGGEVVVYGRNVHTGIATANVTAGAANPVWNAYNAFVTGAAPGARTTVRGALQYGAGLASGNVSVRAAVELQNAGNIAVASAWDLTQPAAWLLGSEPGILRLRAAQTTNVSASLGFPSDAVPDIRSWTIQLVGGANMVSADYAAAQPLATLVAGNFGDVRITASATVPTRVRTGSGDIEIHAGRDFAIDPAATANVNITRAAVFTTGRPAYLDNQGSTGNLPSQPANRFLDRGGDVRITAQRDARGINAEALPVDQQPFVNDWLRRGPAQSTPVPPAAVNGPAAGWWVYRPFFSAGIGSFGGGDVSVAAGNDVNRLSAVTATSQCITGMPGCATTGRIVFGGGDLAVRAGNDILGGEYLVSAGEGVLRAGGAIGRTTRTAFYLMGAHGDPARARATISAEALADLRLQAVANPTLMLSPGALAPPPPGVTLGVLTIGFQNNRPFFPTYGERDRVELSSVAGNIVVDNLARPARVSSAPNSDVAPPQLVLAAPNGSIFAERLEGGLLAPPSAVDLNLFPSPRQSLTVLAGGEIYNLRFAAGEAAPASLPGWSNPTYFTGGVPQALMLRPGVAADRVAFGTSSTTPYQVVAGASIVDVELSLPQRSLIRAGSDILTPLFDLQNLSAADTTVVRAGRDLRFLSTYRSTRIAALGGGYLNVGGPGSLLVQAGRDIDLGNSSGITGIARLNNARLADGRSVDITVIAGYGGDLAAPAIDAFFAALVEAGKAKDLAGGDAAAAALFLPAFLGDRGNLRMVTSAIKSTEGGGITLLAPAGQPGGTLGGNIDVGRPVAAVTTRDLGIVTSFGGAIRSYTFNNLNVNSSKLVTIQGGDIVAYSAHGNLDAGRGSRTATTTTALEFVPETRDGDGNVTQPAFYRVPAVAGGSGIRTVSSDPDGVGPRAVPRPGDVFLFAPRGIIDAGEAGIVSQGNVFVVALQVLNATNIQAQGTSVGVPVASTGALAAGLAGAGAAAAAATQGATQQAAGAAQPRPAFRPSFITVQVLGFGN